MTDDARTHGTIGQNAELTLAALADFSLDAPTWLVNKVAGTSYQAPVHLSADVYSSQAGLDAQQTQAAASAEDKGGVLDAGAQTAGDIAKDPFAPWKAGLGPTLQLVPTWVWIVVAGVAVLVIGYYSIVAFSAVRAIR